MKRITWSLASLVLILLLAACLAAGARLQPDPRPNPSPVPVILTECSGPCTGTWGWGTALGADQVDPYGLGVIPFEVNPPVTSRDYTLR